MDRGLNLCQSGERFGELECTVLSPDSGGKPPRYCVILCHGFGAPGTDLVGLGPELAALCPELDGKVVYLFPQAPHDLTPYGLPGGRAWWMVDLERFQRAFEQPGELLRLRREIPVGMPESSGRLHDLVRDVERRMGIPPTQTLLGGFSQGAMVATDVALRLAEPPAGLCIFSGTLVAEEDWRALAGKRGRLSVLMSHGRYDPLLPFSTAEALRDLLVESGFDVEFVPFAGPHTIPFEGLDRLAALMQRQFAGSRGN